MQRTQEYRLWTSLLASSALRDSISASNITEAEALPAGWVVNHMLPHHPGIVSKGVLKTFYEEQEGKSSNMNDQGCSLKQPSIDTLPGSFVPCCSRCGGPLIPGEDGTETHLEATGKISRSKRRRLSRRTAKLIRNKQQLAPKPHQSNKQPSQLRQYAVSNFDGLQSSEWESDPSRLALTVQAFRLDLAKSRNWIQVRCPCSHVTTFPGIPRSATKKDATKHKDPLLATDDPISQKKAKLSTASSQRKATLPSKRPIAEQKQPPIATSLNNIHGKKKKRGKGNQLMDFLSSLNNN